MVSRSSVVSCVGGEWTRQMLASGKLKGGLDNALEGAGLYVVANNLPEHVPEPPGHEAYGRPS